MSESANVRAIHTIRDLQTALGRFSGEANESLMAADQEIRRTMEWLQERLYHWQRQVERWRQEVQRARTALEQCQRSGDPRHPPDCSAFEAALAHAERRLQEAEAELDNVRRWISRVQQAVGTYQVQARRLQNLATAHTEKGQASLGQVLADLERYQAITFSTTGVVPPQRLTPPQKGARQEERDRDIFGGEKTRITVRAQDNPHLARHDDEAGLGLHKSRRTCDHFIDKDGALWDSKAYGPNSVIDRDQLTDYNMMADAGYIVDTNGIRHNVTSINYLFSSRAGAERNYGLLSEASVFVWYRDDAGGIRCLQQERGDIV